MKKIDDCLITCMDMCKYIEKKTGKENIFKTLKKELSVFCFYICGKTINQKQINYLNKTLSMDIKLKDIDFEINQEALLNQKFETLELFIETDRIFGASDTIFEGKKTKKLIELFETFGEEIKILAEERNQILIEQKIITYMSKMESLNISKNDYNDNNIKEVEKEKSLEELMSELNELTGLQSVKNEINGLVNLLKISKKRKEMGLKEPSISKHMVFTGNPGTGKTTIARLLSSIYHKLGVLSKGQLIEIDRSGLVAGYVGQTAIKTDKVIQEAMGGILFIDEAYTLSENKGEGDFGQEAIDTLLKAMEDNRDNFIVIVAGYPDLMNGFLSSNPGLKSRFNKFIEFEDYNTEELFCIFNNLSEKQDYYIEEESIPKLKEKITQMLIDKDDSFANARTMRNMLEYAIMKQATRIVEIENITDKEITTLKFEDIEGYNISN